MKFLKIFLIIFVLSLPLWFWWRLDQINKFSEIEQLPLTKIPVKLNPEVSILELEARAAISVLINSNQEPQILFQKNADQKLPIASLTKLMTTYLALENYDLNQKITISNNAAQQPNRGRRGKMIAGQEFKVKDLIYATLIESNNIAAYVLAEKIGTEKFIETMNQKAQEWGLQDTYFINPTGLDEKERSNYSTISDLIKLSQQLLKEKPLIWEISSLAEYNLYPFGQLINTNDLLRYFSNDLLKIIGSRTGETPQAKECLILITKAPNNRGYLINIILGSENRYKEMTKLIRWVKLEHQWGIEEIKRKELTSSLNSALLSWEKVNPNAPWGTRDSHFSIVFQDKIWLFGGLDGGKNFDGIYANLPHKNDIWNSDDGKNWQLVTNNAPWGKRRSLQIVEFQNKLWLIGGWENQSGKTKNDVWSSKDGVNWTRAVISTPWTPREGHTVTVFQDKIWLIGGVDFTQRKTMNDVWYSENGINWSKAVFNIPWSNRYDHTTVVFDNKIWLIGGLRAGQIKNDIWVSDDGQNWRLVTNNIPWPKRHGHTSVIFQDRIWIIGGWGIRGGLNDVWSSKDGLTWQPALNKNQWTGREDHTSVVFQDKIWLMGGMDSDLIWKNDIWRSTFLF